MAIYPCDRELLCELLREISADGQAEECADRLIDDFGSLERILCARPEQIFSALRGSREFKEKIVFLLQITKAIARRVRIGDFEIGEVYTEAEIVKYLIGLFLFDPTESVYLLSFDKKHALLGVDWISSGTVNNSQITIRRALELAIRRGATSVILSHNHPLGVATPSPNDVSTTNELALGFSTVNIDLLEHYVIAGRSFAKVSEYAK